MIILLDGPGEYVSLPTCRRCPVMLRIVHSPDRGWDALDQITDIAQGDETIYVYQITKAPGVMHVCSRGPNGRRQGGWSQYGSYRHFAEPIDDATLRDNVAWGAWCDANQSRLMAHLTEKPE